VDDDIFQEVDAEVRAERARKALRRYGGLFAVAAVLAALGAGGWQVWLRHERQLNEAAAAEYLKAGQIADHGEAIVGLAHVAQDAPEGYRTLARLREAALQVDAGKRDAALAKWEAVADDGSADPLLRGLAALMWVDAQIETGDPAALKVRLEKLTPATNPWHGLALEAQALLDIRQGHADTARQTLHILAQDTTAPEGVRGRATSLLARLEGG
jgi:hypothetical protein